MGPFLVDLFFYTKFQERIFQTFQSIKFFPKEFESFLLNEVGYTSSKVVGIPAHHSKGFQRPIYVFTKESGRPITATITSEELLETKSEEKVEEFHFLP